MKDRTDHVRKIYSNLQKTLSLRRKMLEQARFFRTISPDRLFQSDGESQRAYGESLLGTLVRIRNRAEAEGEDTPRIITRTGTTTEREKEGTVAPGASVVWKATSASVKNPASCAYCGNGIPVRMFRLTRTSGQVTQHFHPNLMCLGRYNSEIKSPTFELKIDGDISEQEKRISKQLLNMIREAQPA